VPKLFLSFPKNNIEEPKSQQEVGL